MYTEAEIRVIQVACYVTRAHSPCTIVLDIVVIPLSTTLTH